MSELLAWLVPEASAEEVSALRRLVTALRLLRDDARRPAARAAPPFGAIQAELARQRRLQRLRAVEALVAAYLRAHGERDSFFAPPPPRIPVGEAWLQLQDPGDGVPFPGPGEAPQRVVERLIEAGVAAGARGDWGRYWRAAAAHAFSPRLAVRTWGAAVRSALASERPTVHAARCLAGLAAAYLDASRPRAVRDRIDRHGALAAFHPELPRLCGWSALLVGEVERARALLASAAPAELPRPLVELAAARADWADLLRGSPRAEGVDPPSTSALGRRAFGACILAVLVREESGTRLVALESDRRFAQGALRGAPRQTPPPPGRASRCWRVGAGALDCLGGGRIAAVARVTIAAEPGGHSWIQLEAEHALLPTEARLRALAAEWGRRLVEGHRPALVRPELRANLDPRRAFAERFLAEVAPRTPAAWIDAEPGFQVLARRGRVPRRVLSPGANAELGPRLEEARSPTAVLAPLAGMTVIPLRGRATERTLALLLVRPTPGSDDGEGLAARAHARFDASEGAFWAAVLLDPGRRSGEGELFLSAEAPWMRRAEEVARAASAGPAPVLVVGPGGSGRRALTRWLDAVATGSPCSGGRFLDLDRREAAQTLESDLDGRERPWLLTTEPRESLLARGVIPPALARRLHPESIEVPPLAARRAEIPGLARALAARAARLLGRPLPAWSDEALALLFRQAWSGHLSELGTRVAEIVGQSEERVVASDVRAVLARTGAAPVERLSARPGDLAAAVEATRHRSGKANLARAARYLGWAPETLAAHLARTSRAGASRARAP